MTNPTEPQSRPIVTRAEAIAAGVPRYYTAKPCQRGHVAERTVTSYACIICAHERYLADYEENPQKYRAQSAQWAANNPDRMAQLQKEWGAKNPDNLKAAKATYRLTPHGQQKDREYREKNAATLMARSLKWRADNPERTRANETAWRESHPEQARARVRKWARANPEKTRVSSNNRRARLVAAEGTHTAQEIINLFEKQKGKCCHCLKPITLKKKRPNTATEDHWVSLSSGGRNDIANIKLSCKSCNSKKGPKDPLLFARLMGRLL
jgi:5-methylcytosine-specific restriction endonuclease McrA